MRPSVCWRLPPLVLSEGREDDTCCIFLEFGFDIEGHVGDGPGVVGVLGEKEGAVGVSASGIAWGKYCRGVLRQSGRGFKAL
mgnify:CR=1 FL=1